MWPVDQAPWIHVNCMDTLGPLQLRTMDVIKNMVGIMEDKRIDISAVKVLKFLTHPMCAFSRIPHGMAEKLDSVVKKLVTEECEEWAKENGMKYWECAL